MSNLAMTVPEAAKELGISTQLTYTISEVAQRLGCSKGHVINCRQAAISFQPDPLDGTNTSDPWSQLLLQLDGDVHGMRYNVVHRGAVFGNLN